VSTRFGMTFAMRHRISFLLVAALVMAPGREPIASAGPPTEQIKAAIDQLSQALAGRDHAQGRDAAVDEAMDRLFDWTAMARQSLRQHWQQRTAAERAEFTRLFAGLFQRVYVSRIHLIDPKQFRYLAETIEGDRTTVKTKVPTKQGDVIEVDYVARLAGGQQWRVHDVRVEGVSLIDNYQRQFDSIIGKSSYETLIEKLRERVKDGK
jgi:phospholipid transport system substrate-binding protein